MVRIAEVSGQTRDREQPPPAAQPRKRSAARRPPDSDAVEFLALAPEPGDEEPEATSPSAVPDPAGEPVPDQPDATTEAGTIDLLV